MTSDARQTRVTGGAGAAPSVAWMVAGLVVAAVGAFATVRAVGEAWAACRDLEPAYALTLTYVGLPLTAIVLGVTFSVVAHLARRLRALVRLGLSVVAVFVLAVLLTASQFPMRNSGYEATATCRPDGVPTWWPAWLPS